MRFHPRLASLAARLPRRTVRLRLTALYGILFLASGTGLLAITITNVLARGWPPPQGGTISVGIPRGASPARIHQIQAQAAAQAAHQHAAAVHQHAAAVHQLLTGSAIALGVMAVVSVALGWIVAGRVLRPLRQMTAAAQRISEDNLDKRLAVAGPGDELKDLGDTIDGLLDRLQAAFDAQRNFVANASHELRTPLTLTRTLLQTALTDPRPTLATYRATCQDVLAAGDQQEQLIEALLTLARSQRGLDHRERARPRRDHRRGPARPPARRRAPRAGHQRIDQHRPPPRRRPPAAAADRQPDRQRDPPQHPPRPDQHPGHRQRRPAPDQDHQHRAGHPGRPDHPAAPALPAPVRHPGRRRRRPRPWPVHRRRHRQRPQRHPHHQPRTPRRPRHRHQLPPGHPNRPSPAGNACHRVTRPFSPPPTRNRARRPAHRQGRPPAQPDRPMPGRIARAVLRRCLRSGPCHQHDA